MTRSEIIEKFREENPEITERVVSDVVLNSWCLFGDKEICAKSRCIVGETTFHSVEDQRAYDLTALVTNFYDIDAYPGGGVCYDDDPLEVTTIAKLDSDEDGWRSYASGTPEKYYRRGKYLYFEKAPDASDIDILVYTVLASDDFSNDNQEPFNGLTYLRPFHYAMNLYLTMKAKAKIGKVEEAMLKSRQEYNEFLVWMMKTIRGGTYAPIQFVGPSK